MKPYFKESGSTIWNGDALVILRTLPAESVHCCVTSPPYWGLRDYGVPGQVGLEATPEQYVSRMVEIFGEVGRVLKGDGTCWINLGDTYNNCDKWGGCGVNTGKHTKSPDGSVPSWAAVRRKWAKIPGLKPKDLVGIPWRVALALQADGWYLRSEIIWHKPNPMPESVTDRPTKAHEQIFLLTKSGQYYYDAMAVQEPASPDTHARYGRGRSDKHKWADGGPGCQTIATNNPGSRFARVGSEGQNSRMHQDRDPNHPSERKQRAPGVNPKCTEPGKGIKQNSSFSAAVKDVLDYRNKRSVWTVASDPYPEAHFATFPPALIEPCIKAGCPAGGTVIDPFVGSGTTLEVARRMGCNGIGIELNIDYCKLAANRLRQSVLDLQEVV